MKNDINTNLPRRDECSAEVLAAAFKAWSTGHDLRDRRRRLKAYTYGDQWSDLVPDENGNMIPERELIIKCGKNPLTNNLLRRLIKTVVGRFRATCKIPDETTDSKLAALYSKNYLPELDSRLLEEFLISGCAIQRIVSEHRLQGDGTWIDNVNPEKFFINPIIDPRSWDIELVGMLHDMNLSEAVMRFCHGDRRRAAAISRLMVEESSADAVDSATALGSSIIDDVDFFRVPAGRCRLIEIWTLDSCERLRCHDTATGEYYAIPMTQERKLMAENRRRRIAQKPEIESKWEIAAEWHCRWMTPSGVLVDEYTAPTHPFVIKMYPLTDGEIHPFVEDVIDQQRYVNRLITMIDHIMGTAAKGVLLYPREQLPDEWSWEDVAEAWSRSGTVIPYEARRVATAPQQIYSQGTDVGAYQLLSLEMKMMEDVSGIGSVLQGKEMPSTMSANLYEKQTQNAAIALTDMFASFEMFRSERDRKMQSQL